MREKIAPLHGKSAVLHVTQGEMKNIMKQAVDTVYKLLWLKQNDPEKYAATLQFGNRYTQYRDEPKADECWFWRPTEIRPRLHRSRDLSVVLTHDAWRDTDFSLQQSLANGREKVDLGRNLTRLPYSDQETSEGRVQLRRTAYHRY